MSWARRTWYFARSARRGEEKKIKRLLTVHCFGSSAHAYAHKYIYIYYKYLHSSHHSHHGLGTDGYSKPHKWTERGCQWRLCMLTSELTVHMLKCIVRGHVCCPLIHVSSLLTDGGHVKRDQWKVENTIHYSISLATRKTDSRINHREPTQSVCVADFYFIVNVLDLPFASPIPIYR